MPSDRPKEERRGDSLILTIDKSDTFRDGRLVVYAHDWHGVTFELFIAGEGRRVTMSGEDWAQVVDHVERAKALRE